MTRWVGLDGAVNVRDLGGLPTDDGGTTVAGAVLRSDNLQDLTSADVDLLVGMLRLRRVVDLRTPHEVDGTGPGPLVQAGIEHVRHSMFTEDGHSTDVEAEPVDGEPSGGQPGGAEPGDALLPWQTEAVQAADRSMGFTETPATGFYLGYLRDRPDSVVGALRALLVPDGAAVVHCAAGKDRTGVVVALALLCAGVTREAVVADYVATGERIDAIIDRLRSSPVYAADLEGRDPASHLPRAVAFERFLDEVDSRHGGPLAWLTTHGFGAVEQASLGARLRGEG